MREEHMESDRLKSVALFEGLSDEELDQCAALFQETEMLAGSSLAKEGDFSYKFFVVLEGEVEVLRDFEHVAHLGEGDFFGEMGLMAGARRNARVSAHSRCQLAWMMGWDFEKMTEDFPAVAARIEKAVAERNASLPDSSNS